VTARESDTGANDAFRLRSGKAPSHGAAITVDGTAARRSTLSRAHAMAPEDLALALTLATYGLRIIPLGLAGKDRLAVNTAWLKARVFSEEIREPCACVFLSGRRRSGASSREDVWIDLYGSLFAAAPRLGSAVSLASAASVALS
jgi:hypothetical protein